ncbi:hypothetical protein CEXT_124801 [Caerostris extrusa]|uniref:Uncharacterized protein n=1 Tax=Caerostris extrusa TaxID=172846 RepID=A0AAV4QQI6_CAEEX|nr:hypothetical protein CEXT_124801 [Caerostris extrusa]
MILFQENAASQNSICIIIPGLHGTSKNEDIRSPLIRHWSYFQKALIRLEDVPLITPALLLVQASPTVLLVYKIVTDLLQVVLDWKYFYVDFNFTLRDCCLSEARWVVSPTLNFKRGCPAIPPDRGYLTLLCRILAAIPLFLVSFCASIVSDSTAHLLGRGTPVLNERTFGYNFGNSVTLLLRWGGLRFM